MPLSTTLEDVSRAIDDELRRVADGIDHRLDLEISAAVDKPQDGMVRYFDTQTYSPSNVTGLHLFKGGEWFSIATTLGAASWTALKLFSVVSEAGVSIIPEGTYNVFDVSEVAPGDYRITFEQATFFGQPIINMMVPVFTVYAVNKQTEGFINTMLHAYGTDGNNRAYVEVRLTETVVQGTSLRAVPYTLTAPERLYAYGLGNFTDPSVPTFPP